MVRSPSILMESRATRISHKIEAERAGGHVEIVALFVGGLLVIRCCSGGSGGTTEELKREIMRLFLICTVLGGVQERARIRVIFC